MQALEVEEKGFDDLQHQQNARYLSLSMSPPEVCGRDVVAKPTSASNIRGKVVFQPKTTVRPWRRRTPRQLKHSPSFATRGCLIAETI